MKNVNLVAELLCSNLYPKMANLGSFLVKMAVLGIFLVNKGDIESAFTSKISSVSKLRRFSGGKWQLFYRFWGVFSTRNVHKKGRAALTTNFLASTSFLFLPNTLQNFAHNFN